MSNKPADVFKVSKKNSNILMQETMQSSIQICHKNAVPSACAKVSVMGKIDWLTWLFRRNVLNSNIQTTWNVWESLCIDMYSNVHKVYYKIDFILPNIAGFLIFGQTFGVFRK